MRRNWTDSRDGTEKREKRKSRNVQYKIRRRNCRFSSSLSEFQSDVELMLLNQIHYRNGQLVLELSREDAADIGIQEELWQKYYDEIKKTGSALTDNQNTDKVQ